MELGMSISEYLEEFKNVRPNRSKGRASPHKACMLYAVMDLIEEGQLDDNKITLSPELKNRFAWHFENSNRKATC